MIGDVTAIAWLVGAIGMAYMWVKICKSAEDDVDDTYRRRLKRWFLRESNQDDEPPNWAGSFITLYDHTFGTRPWTINFFLRSCLATTIFAALMILVYWGAGRITPEAYADFVDLQFEEETEWQQIQWLLVVFVGNLFIDYFSLIETRWILRKIEGRSKSVSIFLVILDVFLTFVIFYVISYFLIYIEQVWQSEFTSFSSHLRDKLKIFDNTDLPVVYYELVQHESSEGYALYSDSYRIGLITTYFTSIWIWLFVLSGVFGRLFLVFRGSITRLGRIFRVQDKPVTAVGYVLAILTLIAHLMIYIGVSAHAAIAGPETPIVSDEEN